MLMKQLTLHHILPNYVILPWKRAIILQLFLRVIMVAEKKIMVITVFFNFSVA